MTAPAWILVHDMSESADVAPIDRVPGPADQGAWRIDNEIVLVTDRTSVGATYNGLGEAELDGPEWPIVERGHRGTTPAAHRAGARMTRLE